MTKEEELQEQIDALANKNAEILNELKQERKSNRSNEIDSDKHYALLDEVADLKAKLTKSEYDIKTVNKNFEDATLLNKDFELKEVNHITESTINKLLNGLEKHKLNDGASALAMMDIKSNEHSIVGGELMFGNEKASEFIGKWVENPSSKNLVTPNENSGGGAGGNNNNGGNNNEARFFDKSNKDYSLTEQGRVYNENRALYDQLSK